MELKKLLVSILFLIPILSNGQINLTGKIVDSADIPLPSANIILMDKENNIIIAGIITDNKGVFNFENLKKGRYQITVSFLGFESLQKEVELTETQDFGPLVLMEASNQLEGVLISAKGKKPLIEMKIDRTIFNLSQSDAAIGGNTIDALRITPGLKIKEADSEIEMVGKGSVKLMVNDKEIRLDGKSAFEYLKSIPAEQIESIEMITNPPSKYTAEGSYGIINLMLKKGKQDHFYGIVSGSFRKAKYWSHNENLSLFYHKNNLQINAGGNYFDYRSNQSNKESYQYPNYTLFERENMKSSPQGFGGFLELQYELTKRTSIGGNLRYSRTPNGRLSDLIDHHYLKHGQIDSILQTNLSQKQKTDNLTYSLFMDHQIDSSGSNLSSEFSYTRYAKSQNQNALTENLQSSDKFNLGSANDQHVHLLYAALDMALNRDFADYGFGLQFSNSRNRHSAVYINPDLADQNSLFNYDETIYSAYFSALKNFNEKWALQLGLRSEYTDSKGNSLILNQITKRDYLEFFPTGYLSYTANEDHSFTASYGKRIDRPPYRTMDPFRQYVSRHSYLEGNPYLRPAYNNNFELKHLYKNKLSTSLYFSYLPNDYGIIDLVFPESNNIASVYDNYLKTYRFGLTESYVWKPFSWWESDNTGQVYYSKSTSTNPNTRPKLSGFGAYVNSNNTLNINKQKTFRANLSFTYYSPEVDGVNKDKAYYFLDVGITALCFGKNLTLSLNANDIFKTAIYKTNSEINGIRQDYKGYFDSRSVRFTASYKFGDSKIQRQREVYDDNKERID